MPSGTIVDIASADPQIPTLVAAVKTAGLADTLSGKGSFTVFAPTNAAFSKLGKTTNDALLADPARLKSILTCHVVSKQLAASDVLGASFVSTVNGANAVISRKNGVIHVIDTIILPPQWNGKDYLQKMPTEANNGLTLLA